MHGPLSEIGLIEVLQLLERGNRNGVLRVIGPDRSSPRTLQIHNGQLVGISPDADDGAIDRSMVRQQMVDPAAESDQLRVAPLREEVREELARRSLDMMVHWENGRFDFDECTTVPGAIAWTSQRHVHSLVSTEIRRAELAESLDDWHAIAVFTDPEVIATGEQLVLDSLDWRILDVVDGSRDVAGVAALLDESLEVVGERIQRLVASAIFQLEKSTDTAEVPVEFASEAGRYDDAVAELRSRVSSQPNDADAWRSLGLAEIGVGRFDRAVEAWSAWQEAEPSSSEDAAVLIKAATTMMEALSETRD
jgi:hypothetical protein